MNKFTKVKKALAVSVCSSMLFSGAPKTSGMNCTNSKEYINSTESFWGKVLSGFTVEVLVGTASAAVVLLIGVSKIKEKSYRGDLSKLNSVYDKAYNLIYNDIDSNKVSEEAIKDAKSSLELAKKYIDIAESYRVGCNSRFLTNFINTNSLQDLRDNKKSSVHEIIGSFNKLFENKKDDKNFSGIFNELNSSIVSSDYPEIKAEAILNSVESKLIEKKIIKKKDKNNDENKEEEKKVDDSLEQILKKDIKLNLKSKKGNK